jgi:hypothetical protein
MVPIEDAILIIRRHLVPKSETLDVTAISGSSLYFIRVSGFLI